MGSNTGAQPVITVKAETEEAKETEVTQTIKELLNKLEEIKIKA